MDRKLQKKEIYQQLVDSIGNTIEKARQRAIRAVNNELLRANWEVGRYNVEYKQDGSKKQNMEVLY